MNRLRAFLGSRPGLAVLLIASTAGIYLLATHTGHVLAALPYLLLAACPLMHLFGHRHRHGPTSPPGTREDNSSDSAASIGPSAR
jgi:DUF2933 family protein